MQGCSHMTSMGGMAWNSKLHRLLVCAHNLGRLGWLFVNCMQHIGCMPSLPLPVSITMQHACLGIRSHAAESCPSSLPACMLFHTTHELGTPLLLLYGLVLIPIGVMCLYLQVSCQPCSSSTPTSVTRA